MKYSRAFWFSEHSLNAYTVLVPGQKADPGSAPWRPGPAVRTQVFATARVGVGGEGVPGARAREGGLG